MSVIDDTRALLRLFEQSGSKDLHVRVGGYALFIARPGGHANPMRAAPAAVAALAPVAADAATHVPLLTVTAPHIATFVSAIAVGSAVEAGDFIVRLDLLGEPVDLVAEQAGFVEAVLAEPGAVVEYGTPLVRIIAAA